VIYIKAGAYFENVEVERKKTKLMFIGDGIGKTVVKASRNVVDKWTTFQSATVGEFENLYFLFSLQLKILDIYILTINLMKKCSCCVIV
jgi:hypothetical protein